MTVSHGIEHGKKTSILNNSEFNNDAAALFSRNEMVLAYPFAYLYDRRV